MDLAAPGGDMRSSAANGILSTLNAGATAPGADNDADYQGTSMATPHVAGVVALMLAKTATLTPNSSSDYDLYLYNSAGTQIASSIKGTGAVDSVSTTNGGASSATYYVRVRFYSGGTGSTSGK